MPKQMMCDEYCAIYPICELRDKDSTGKCLATSKPLSKTVKGKLREAFDVAIQTKMLEAIKKADRVFPAP